MCGRRNHGFIVWYRRRGSGFTGNLRKDRVEAILLFKFRDHAQNGRGFAADGLCDPNDDRVPFLEVSEGCLIGTQIATGVVAGEQVRCHSAQYAATRLRRILFQPVVAVNFGQIGSEFAASRLLPPRRSSARPTPAPPDQSADISAARVERSTFAAISSSRCARRYFSAEASYLCPSSPAGS